MASLGPGREGCQGREGRGGGQAGEGAGQLEQLGARQGEGGQGGSASVRQDGNAGEWCCRQEKIKGGEGGGAQRTLCSGGMPPFSSRTRSYSAKMLCFSLAVPGLPNIQLQMTSDS